MNAIALLSLGVAIAAAMTLLEWALGYQWLAFFVLMVVGCVAIKLGVFRMPLRILGRTSK